MSNKLFVTADNNNKGIEAEGLGDILKAIEFYEANLKEGYPATHSYERLMIIYKKLKRLPDELRVINRAIDVFSLENNRRLKSALTKSENKEYLVDIQAGMLTGTTIRNKSGKVIFNPYLVLKYINRRNKLTKL